MRIDHGDHGDHGGENGFERAGLIHSDISDNILDAAIKVHRAPGPGLLESAYEICLFHELHTRGMQVQRQVDLPIRYNNVVLESGYRIDLVVENAIIVEVKSNRETGSHP